MKLKKSLNFLQYVNYLQKKMFNKIKEVITKTLANELRGKYSEKEIKQLIKLLTPKKVVTKKSKDYTKLLNFIADTKN